jgi:hypothetical protein
MPASADRPYYRLLASELASYRKRFPDYAADLLGAGVMDTDGLHWTVPLDDWRGIRERFKNELDAECCGQTKSGFGLGDLVYWILHPGVLLMDRVFKTRWQDCHTCALRRRRMNRWWHKATISIRRRLNLFTIRKTHLPVSGDSK